MTGYADLVTLRTVADEAQDRAERARAAHAAAVAAGRGGAAVRAAALRAESAGHAAAAARADLDAAVASTVGQLDPEVPLLLLPVRIETRYRVEPSGAVTLLVRVYPTLDIDEHEPALTPSEVEHGTAFWRAARAAEDAGERQAAWTRLVLQLGEPRAAWVRAALTPVDDPPEAEPRFPEPPAQAARWMRARRAVLQPDRWVAHAYRGGIEIATGHGGLVTRPLAAGPDPQSREGVEEPDDPADLVDPGMRWMVDFAEASRVGMGLVLTLPDQDPVDLLTVVGVRGTQTATQDAQAVADLFTAHRFHAGLDLVAAGTPTNSSDAGRSGLAPPDPLGVAEPGARPRPAAGSDAELLAAALGLDPVGLLDLPHAGLRGVADQADMATLLWPGTWGYYLTQLLRLPDVAGHGALDTWRRWVLDTVRAAGPLPTARFADQPLGTLPATSLTRWRARDLRGNLLVAELIQPPAGAPRTRLRVLGELDDRGGWTFWAPLPGDLATPPAATGLAVAARDRNGDGAVEVLLGYAGSAADAAAPAPGVVGCPLFALRADGVDRTGVVELPPLAVAHPGEDPTPRGLGLALGSLTAARVHAPDGRIDLVAVVQTPASVLAGTDPRVEIHVGRDLDRTGAVRGGWAPPLDVSAEFGAAERIVGACLLDDPDFGRALGVVSVGRGGAAPASLRVARGITVDGGIAGAWSAPIDIGSGAADVVSAAAVVDDSGPPDRAPRMFLAQFRDLDDQQFTSDYRTGEELVDGIPTTWTDDTTTAGEAEPPGTLLGGGMATVPRVPTRSPASGLTAAAGRVNLLGALVEAWRAVLPQVARVRPGDPDPGRTLLDLLTTDDLSGAYRTRPFVGTRVANALRLVLEQPTVKGDPPAWNALAPLLDRFGLSVPPIPRLGDGGFAPSATDVAVPLVVDPATPGWEDEQVPWLAEMLRASPAELYVNFTGDDVPLLAKLVRHSLLQSYCDAAFALVPVPGADPPPLPEPELVDAIDVTAADPANPVRTLTSWRHLTEAMLDGRLVLDVITEELAAGAPPPELAPLAETLSALRRLARRPAGELTRLAAGTLDAATHRLDAWVTAVATDRLRALRATTPDGLHVGGYGFVTDLRPAAAPVTTGFVHAPSPAHAVTAGVLRSGFLTHRDEALAVDLSSTRVRAALDALAAVREGSTLGAVLGHRFERELHDRGLAAYLGAFRQLAPEQVGVLTPTPDGTAVDTAAALVTVDGLELLALVERGEVPWDTTPAGQAQRLPAPGSDDHRTLTAVLTRLRDGADAISDVGVAESVHQTVQRNPIRAGGSLDALARGELPPPEPEVVRTPRTGTGVTHRVLVLTPDPDEPAAAAALARWTADPAQRALHTRAAAEPRLNAWTAQVLGDPARVRWRVVHLDPATSDPTGPPEELTLADVGLCPLDVLYAASPDVAALEESDLGARLRHHVARLPAAAHRTGLADTVFDRDPEWPPDLLSVPELLTVADAARAVAAAARAATAADLGPVGRTGEPGVRVAELHERAAAAQAALSDVVADVRDLFALDDAERDTLAGLFPGTGPTVAVASLVDLPLSCDLALAVARLDRPAADDLGPVQAGVERLSSFGLPGADPTPRVGPGDDLRVLLAAQARALVLDAGRRLAAADAAADDGAALAAVLGAGFLALPLIDVVPELVAPSGATDDATSDWFDAVARVDEPVGALTDVLLLAETTGGAPARLQVVQHPPDGGRWAALPLPPSDTDDPRRMPAGTVSIVLVGTGAELGVDPGRAAFVVDSWVDVVPDPEQDTAVAFHFDAPDNQAPQAMLLAVHPDPALEWDDDTVADVVSETAELAHLRMVDPYLVPALGQLLPAAVLAQNVGGDPFGDTVSTDLRAR